MTIKRTPKLSRRTFLRGCVAGTTVALGLPILEAMINDKGVFADGQTLKPFFGVFYWANGLPWHAGHGATQAQGNHPDLWTPSNTGANYAASTLLEPLTRHRVNVATGLEPHTDVPPQPPGQNDGHMRGFMVALTGDRPRTMGFEHNSHTLTSRRPSIDQYVANHPDFYSSDDMPRFKSLEVGVSKARFHDYGHWNAISYNGPNSLNLPIMRPTALYDRLFNVPTDTDDNLRRSQLLDAVLADANDLKRQLGAQDKQRLEAHLSHIETIKRRLGASAQSCMEPMRPTDSGDLIARTTVTAELLAMAINCGLTRVFSFMLTSPASTHVFSNLSVPNGMHKTCHDGHWAQVRDITRYQMQAFAAFLDAFDLPSPTGEKLIDHGCIMGTSEYGEGWKHSVKELPMIIAGGAQGRLNRQVHTREQGGNLSKAHVTALAALGIKDPAYGFNGGQTQDAITGFLK